MREGTGDFPIGTWSFVAEKSLQLEGVSIFVHHSQLLASWKFWKLFPKANRTPPVQYLSYHFYEWLLHGMSDSLSLLQHHHARHHSLTQGVIQRGYAPFLYCHSIHHPSPTRRSRNQMHKVVCGWCSCMLEKYLCPDGVSEGNPCTSSQKLLFHVAVSWCFNP